MAESMDPRGASAPERSGISTVGARALTYVRKTPEEKRQYKLLSRKLKKAARKGRNFGLPHGAVRRNRLIAFALLAIPLLALSLGIVRFVTMPLTQAWALSAYHGGNYAAVSGRLWPVDNANFFESYLPSLTRGTAELKAGDSATAKKDLQESLKIWERSHDLNKPPHAECKIRNNLAIAMADEAKKLPTAAEQADALTAAEEVLKPCQNGGSSSNNNEDKQSTSKTGDQIEKDRKEADSKAGRSTDPTSPSDQPHKDPNNNPQRTDSQGTNKGGQTPTPAPSGDNKKDQLENQNQGANDPSNGESDKKSSNKDDSKVTKPW